MRPVHAHEQSHASDAGVGIGFLERRECRVSRSWLQSIDRPTPTIPDKTASRILSRIRNVSGIWYWLNGSQISRLYVYNMSLWPNYVFIHMHYMGKPSGKLRVPSPDTEHTDLCQLPRGIQSSGIRRCGSEWGVQARTWILRNTADRTSNLTLKGVSQNDAVSS